MVHDKAIIVVDMQNDFIDGSLAVPGSLAIIGPMQNYLATEWLTKNSVIMFTRDWHPTNHCSFVAHGGEWPAHCIAHTRGALLQIGLESMRARYDWQVFSKGLSHQMDEYSGYRAVKEAVEHTQAKHIEICGLARDYCVQATYDDFVKAGYDVSIRESLCCSVRPLPL